MKCPLCNKKISKIITDELRDGTRQKVFFCEQCELGMLDAHVSEDSLKKYYNKEYRSIGKPKLSSISDPAELFEIYQEFQGDRLRLLTPHFGKTKKLLEIGCSSGMFLYRVKNKVGTIAGIDYDTNAAAYAAKKCECSVYTTDPEKTPLEKESFDIVTAFQVLEHVKSPTKFIKDIGDYLKPDGIMAIEIPNLTAALLSVYDLPFYKKFFFHKSHLWYHTEKSLGKLMAMCGYHGKIHYVQDYNFINHMNWIINDRPQPDCRPGMRPPSFPFRNDAPVVIKKALQGFIIKTDTEYKKILNRFKATANLLYIGKKLPPNTID